MNFSIHKQNNKYDFFVYHNKNLVLFGTTKTRKQTLKVIFETIKSLLTAVPLSLPRKANYQEFEL